MYNHDAYIANRAVSADIMEPSHASSQVPATSVKKRLFDTVVEMSEVYARAPVGISLTLLHVCTPNDTIIADTRVGSPWPTCRGGRAAPSLSRFPLTRRRICSESFAWFTAQIFIYTVQYFV